MRVAYFDCFAGISGDMVLGALVDSGADFDALKTELAKLRIGGYEVTAGKAVKHGIAATDITVALAEHQHGRAFSEIAAMIGGSGLSDSVKDRAVAIFRRLGEAEAKIHGVAIEQIHFHEVGAVDAIVDIVGACICLETLGIEKVYASAMPTFHGTVRMAHGTFPLPAPATAELLRGVPWTRADIEGEIVTPTGAAIITELAESFGDMPEMTIEAVGYGAGKKDFGVPNVLRVMVGEMVSGTSSRNTSAASGDMGVPNHQHQCAEVAVLETNIDDISPQVYEVVMERLFAAGALDVYLAPIQMKKNRPAVLLSVICAPEDIDAMSAVLFEETSTIGIRVDRRERICLPRETVTVETEFGTVSIKVARRDGEVVNIQPEYEDCKAASADSGVPVKRVRDAAVTAYYCRVKC